MTLAASLLLTPFRTQNIPPPMCSHELALKVPDVSLPSFLRRSPAPVHAAFASHSDVLAALWESGIVEVFDLKTRLGPGRGKVLDPVSIWSGVLEGAGSRSYRQAVFDQSIGPEGAMRLALLGTDPSGDTNDILCVLDIQGQESKQTVVPLPARNGRLIAGLGLFWQGSDARIHEGPHMVFVDTPLQAFLMFSQLTSRAKMSPKSLTSLSFASGPLRRPLASRDCTLASRTQANCTSRTAK